MITGEARAAGRGWREGRVSVLDLVLVIKRRDGIVMMIMMFIVHPTLLGEIDGAH